MKVYQAIAAVMAELAKDGIQKNSKNTQQGYAFRGIDAVYNALAPKLAANGLCVLPRVLSRETVERVTQKGGILFYTVLEVEFDFVSSEDGSKHTIRTIGEAMDAADKSTNKAMSAAYKYACLQAFCIPTEGDNDADETTHDVAPSKLPKVIPEVNYPNPEGTKNTICESLRNAKNRTEFERIYRQSVLPLTKAHPNFKEELDLVASAVAQKYPKEAA